MALKPIEFARARGMSTAEFIEHMQTAFPKYCKASNSMANRAEEYGVSLSPAALRYLDAKPKERRTRPNQFTFRLLDADSDAFNRARLRKGQTVQEAVEQAVLLYIAKEEADAAYP